MAGNVGDTEELRPPDPNDPEQVCHHYCQALVQTPNPKPQTRQRGTIKSLLELPKTLNLIFVGVSVHLPVSEDQSAGHKRPAAAEGARSDEYLKCSINYESVYFSVYLCKSMPQFQFYISSPSLITESVVLN